MKLVSGSVRPAPKWSLKKTLKRKPSARPIEHEDLRFIWAAYAKGALASMGDEWAGGELEPDEFGLAFEKMVLENFHGAWVLFSDVPEKGKIPIGFFLAFLSHPNPDLAPFMILADQVWFPWSSPRMRVEATVNFFNEVRDEVPLMKYVSKEHMKFFEMVARHGIIRRVGTSHIFYPGQATAVFETIKRKK